MSLVQRLHCNPSTNVHMNVFGDVQQGYHQAKCFRSMSPPWYIKIHERKKFGRGSVRCVCIGFQYAMFTGGRKLIRHSNHLRKSRFWSPVGGTEWGEGSAAHRPTISLHCFPTNQWHKNHRDTPSINPNDCRYLLSHAYGCP